MVIRTDSIALYLNAPSGYLRPFPGENKAREHEFGAKGFLPLTRALGALLSG